MTKPSPEPPQRSLIMQRTALNWARAFARAAAVIGVVLVMLSVASRLAGGNLVVHLLQLVFAVALVIFASLRLTQARKHLREFEEENRPGAGDQTTAARAVLGLRRSRGS